MKKLIALDAGHGMNTVGKRTPAMPDGKVMREREFNKAVVNYMTPLLKNIGFDVLNVAESDTDFSLSQRTALANNKIKNIFNRPADYYLSIHANAAGNGAEWSSAQGIETFIHSNIKQGSNTEIWGLEIHKQLIQATRRKDRGLKKADFQVLRETIMPAALVECGFMTNLDEAKLLCSDQYRKICAEALVKGICNIFNVQENKTTPIIGKATATLSQAKAWAKNKNASNTFIALADTFWEVATKAGVNPVLVYCQSAKETGYGKFGGVLDESYCNPCGMKNTGGGGDYDKNAHKRFNNWREGIEAQTDHLALYAGATGYPKKITHDPRHFPYLKGKCKTIEELGGNWAPAKTYGKDIIKIMNDLTSMKAEELQNKGNTKDVPAWQKEAFQKLVKNGIIKTPEYWEDKLSDPITVGEMFAVIANI